MNHTTNLIVPSRSPDPSIIQENLVDKVSDLRMIFNTSLTSSLKKLNEDRVKVEREYRKILADQKDPHHWVAIAGYGIFAPVCLWWFGLSLKVFGKEATRLFRETSKTLSVARATQLLPLLRYNLGYLIGTVACVAGVIFLAQPFFRKTSKQREREELNNRINCFQYSTSQHRGETYFRFSRQDLIYGNCMLEQRWSEFLTFCKNKIEISEDQQNSQTFRERFRVVSMVLHPDRKNNRVLSSKADQDYFTRWNTYKEIDTFYQELQKKLDSEKTEITIIPKSNSSLATIIDDKTLDFSLRITI